MVEEQSAVLRRSFAGESLERERFGEHVQKSLRCGLGFGVAKANLESFNRSAIHVSLIALYGLGGWLVNQGLMPFRVLASAIGYTFSLVFATQGILGTTTEYQRMLSSVKRYGLNVQCTMRNITPAPTLSRYASESGLVNQPTLLVTSNGVYLYRYALANSPPFPLIISTMLMQHRIYSEELLVLF